MSLGLFIGFVAVVLTFVVCFILIAIVDGIEMALLTIISAIGLLALIAGLIFGVYWLGIVMGLK